MKRLLLLFSAVVLAGCAQSSPPDAGPPAYHWTDDPAALRELAHEAHLVKTLSAAALLTLTRANGQSVRLDGAVAISLPDKSVRLRAWKLGQAVFDLTLISRGLWIELPKGSGPRRQIAPATLNASQFARAVAILGGEVFEGPGVEVFDHGGPRFAVRKALENGQFMIAEIDRRTLNVRQYRLMDAAKVVHFTLTLQDYRLLNAIYWPTRLTAKSEAGIIEVRLRDVELNGDLPDGAFIPPRGAEKAS